MYRIYKYPISPGRPSSIELEDCVQILTVQVQNNEPYLWALMDSKKQQKTKRIYVFTTGEDIDSIDNLEYINSFQVDEGDGPLAFHVFYEDM